MRRYSGRQLIAAKCAVVAVAALVAGPALANGAGDLAISIIVVFAMLGACLAVYEVLSHGLALVLGRITKRSDGESVAVSLGTDGEASLALSSTPAKLRRRDVLWAFLWYLTAGAFVWTVAAMVATVQVGVDSEEEAITHALKPMVPVALPLSVIAAGIALLFVLHGWRKRLGPKRLAEMIGLSWGMSRHRLIGIVCGATLSLLFIVFTPLLPEAPEPDLIAEAAMSSGPGRWAWIISVVLLAPPIEELMFRGVLLGGLAETWNMRAAVLVSAGTFWLMHATEWLEYWPGAIAIGMMTVVVTWVRLRSRSLGPSIAAHLAYNLILAGAVSSVTPADAPRDGTEGPRWAQLDGTLAEARIGVRVTHILPVENNHGR